MEKKERGKISFSNHKCVSVSSLPEVALHFKTFLPFSSTTNSQRIIHMEQKKGEWMTHFVELVLFSDLLISLLASVHCCNTNHYFWVWCTYPSKGNVWILPNDHPIFLKINHFMFHFMSSLVTWDVVILVLIILKPHDWLRDF